MTSDDNADKRKRTFNIGEQFKQKTGSLRAVQIRKRIKIKDKKIIKNKNRSLLSELIFNETIKSLKYFRSNQSDQIKSNQSKLSFRAI